METCSNTRNVLVLLFFTFYFSSSLYLPAQPLQTANDTVPVFEGNFSFGINPGSYSYAGGSQFWTDEQLAEIAAGTTSGIPGVGINAFRLPLFEFFLETWSYDIRLNTFQYYDELGITDNTVFMGFPSAEHQEDMEYCPGESSKLFKNLYTPIWDNGANGTPYNDNNYYASYVYRMVEVYKDYVKYWEVWNEPDFSFTGNAFAPPGTPGSWWDVDPPACELQNLKAPLYHYVRLLRISYEVIKTLDPEAYVAIGGIGFPSFLHAVLRNTDNPDNGDVSASYPLTGGAYFDMLSYHSYLHINGSLRYWNNQIQDWTYTRHSDAAAQKGLIDLKGEFDQVLKDFDYDGLTYPEKEWMITESNVPRKSINSSFGSDEAQRNYVMKSAILCKKNKIRQLALFELGERATLAETTEEWQLFNLMGLYQKLDGTAPGNQQVNESGIAFKTTADLILDKKYDEVATTELELPSGIQGLAFQSNETETVYALWASTTIDQSEVANQSYIFPPALQAKLNNADAVILKKWDASYTLDSSLIDPAQAIALNGTPLFIQVKGAVPLPVELSTFEVNKLGDSDAQLDWSTQTEYQLDYFSIERSEDVVVWDSLAQSKAAGISSSNIQYAYLDKAVFNSNDPSITYYYRLKMVDENGEFSYSPVRSVLFTTSTTTFPDLNSFLVYPNPAQAGEAIQIKVQLPSKSYLVSLLDISGRILEQWEMTNGEKRLPLSEKLGAGLYLLQLSDDRKVLGREYLIISNSRI